MQIQTISFVNFSELPGADNFVINDRLCDRVSFGDGDMCCLKRDDMLCVLHGLRSKDAMAMRAMLKSLPANIWVNVEA